MSRPPDNLPENLPDNLADNLHVETLARLVEARMTGRSLIGIGGGVCVGKTTLAGVLAAALARAGRAPAVICTDAFLLPNDELDDRGLSYRKGFPESFDVVGLEQCLINVRKGPVDIPVYSHATYDVLEGQAATVDGDVIIVEGVNVLQEPVIRHLDLAIYVDADDADVKGWFIERFLRLRDAGRTDPSSFYAAMADFEDVAVEGIAHGVWEAVNVPNLDQHIRPGRGRAHVVVVKAKDHAVLEIVEQRP